MTQGGKTKSVVAHDKELNRKEVAMRKVMATVGYARRDGITQYWLGVKERIGK